MAKQSDRKGKTIPPAERAIQFKVALKYIVPPIWRRVVVPDNYSLGHLHLVIYASMGWLGGHLHAFRIGKTSYVSPDTLDIDVGDFLAEENEDDVMLRDIVRAPRQKFLYEYDFGDGWQHTVTVEKFLPLDYAIRYPICVAGERACPPEDCGGPWGYGEILEALAAKRKKRYQKERLEWTGPYDPEAFDLKAVNDILTGG